MFDKKKHKRTLIKWAPGMMATTSPRVAFPSNLDEVGVCSTVDYIIYKMMEQQS
jgi:hypothetical protein